MSLIFLKKKKWSKFDEDFRNAMKISEKVFGFLDHIIWIAWGKFSLVWPEYMPSAIKLLTNNPKISYLTKRDVLQLNLSENDKTIR